MNNITIYSKKNPMSRGQFSRLFELMEYSFPQNERRDFKEQFEEFQKPLFRSLVLSENDKIIGFLNYWELSELIYIEHFAIDRTLRGKGLGTGLVGKFREITENRPAVLEAEPPELNDTAFRRVEFYKRLGFRLNDYGYLQPPYRAGETPVRLVIMSSPNALSPEEFERARSTIYREAYETDESFLNK